MTPATIAAASSLCHVANRPGQANYCLTHSRNAAPGHALCSVVETVVERIVAAVTPAPDMRPRVVTWPDFGGQR